MRWKALIVVAVAAASLGVTAIGPASATTATPKPFTFAAYGDSPYGTSPTDTAQITATPGFIDSVNADPDVSLVMHIGDIHSGKQYCTQAYDQQVFDLWKNFSDPLVYTPATTRRPTATRRPRVAVHTTRQPVRSTTSSTATGTPLTTPRVIPWRTST